MKRYVLLKNNKIIDTNEYHHFEEHYDSERGYYLISIGGKDKLKFYENEIKLQTDNINDLKVIDKPTPRNDIGNKLWENDVNHMKELGEWERKQWNY